MRTEILTYEADGLQMQSHLYLDDSAQGRRPGVLVFPEAFGLGEHAKSRAERLAALGYVALACDLHGEGVTHDDLDAVIGIIQPLRQQPERTRARAGGGLDALAARPEVDASRIAAIGYCFGGSMALELVRAGRGIVGAVGFHSGLATASPAAAGTARGKVLVCLGADDPSINAEQRGTFEREMREAGLDWQMHVYGGVVHSFTNPAAGRLARPDFARYDAGADTRSWAAMLGFFEDVFAAGRS